MLPVTLPSPCYYYLRAVPQQEVVSHHGNANYQAAVFATASPRGDISSISIGVDAITALQSKVLLMPRSLLIRRSNETMRVIAATETTWLGFVSDVAKYYVEVLNVDTGVRFALAISKGGGNINRGG